MRKLFGIAAVVTALLLYVDDASAFGRHGRSSCGGCGTASCGRGHHRHFGHHRHHGGCNTCAPASCGSAGTTCAAAAPACAAGYGAVALAADLVTDVMVQAPVEVQQYEVIYVQ
jgi:hypothetical protein